MARLWSSGFELNSNTTDVEWTQITNSPTIQTTTVRSGTYAGQATSFSSGARKSWAYRFGASATNGPFYFRFYFRYATAPSADNMIFGVSNGTGADTDSRLKVKITSSGTLKLTNSSNTQIGSDSSVLSTDTWYRVEVLFDNTGGAGAGVAEAKIDGTTFASASDLTYTVGVQTMAIGGNVNLESQTTGDWFFDDLAINDSTGSFQNSYPGEGEIIHLRPNAAGDTNNWTEEIGSANEWENVDEITPDDATTYNDSSTTAEDIDEYNLEATPAALASGDTINCVQVGWRFRAQVVAGTQPTVVQRIKASSGGTVEESSAVTFSTTTWNTNATAAPRNYQLTLYDLPGASTTAWSKTELDTAQIGVRLTNSPTGDAHLSTMWLLVDHKPAPIEQEGFAFGDDDGNEASHTLDTQDTNVTEPLGVKTLRTLLNATGDPSSAAYKLKYQKDGSGGYVDVPITTTTDITPTPVTDEGTESGNNTETGSWAVSYPNASTGDLIIIGISWDDSTDTTDVTEPAGPNSEVLSEVNATPAVSASTEVRCKVWYTIATGAWTASTLTFTPSANEQWTAAVVVIPAGEFDATTPIGANTTDASAAANETDVLSAAFSAGASDGGGRVFCWTAADADPQTLAADWTEIANEDRGAVSGGMFTRNAVVTDSESIAEDTVSTIASDSWCSVSFVVRPYVQTNEVYVSTSANVTAGGEATTARLTAPSGKTTSDFDTGRRWDDENGSDSIDITADDYTELEWVLTTQSPAANDDYFEFRVYNEDIALNTYTVTPKWTIGTGGGAPATTTAYTITMMGV